MHETHPFLENFNGTHRPAHRHELRACPEMRALVVKFSKQHNLALA